MTDAAREPDKYWAFISYSHKDDLAAARLHRSLERYVIPSRLVGSVTAVGPVPRRLFPVFRDKDELPSAASLPAQVRDALAASRNLIVVCSPNAVASKWVDSEVLCFKQLGRSDRVFCLLVDGEPGASEKPDSGLAEAFPASVRYELGPDGALSTTRAEPLAADHRQPKTPWRPVLLRLVAGLLGLDYDTLAQRDARARTVRRVQFAALAAAALVAGGAAWLQQHLAAVREREIAELRQLTQVARGLVDGRSGDVETGVLLGIEAMARADFLGESPEAALQVVRDGASLLPSRTGWRLDPPPAETASVTFSPDGRWACAPGTTGIDVWQTASGKHAANLPGHPTAIQATCNAVPSLGTKSDAPYKLLAAGIERAMAAPAAETGAAGTAAFSDDGRWVARVDGPAERVRLIDTRTGTAVREFDFKQLVDRMQFTPDGARLIGYGAGMSNVGAQDSGVIVWDRDSGRVVLRRPFATYVDALATAPDTHLIAIASGASVKIVDADSGALVQTISTSTSLFGEHKPSLALSRQGRWLAFGNGVEVRVWHVPTASLVARVRGQGKVNRFSPNGRYLLTADGSMWGMNTAAQLAQFLSEQETAQSFTVADQKPVLAHGSRIGPVTIWNLDTGDIVKQLDEQVWSRVVAIDAQARILLAMNGTTLGGMQAARVWDIASGKRRGELAPGGSIINGAISADAATVALRVDGRGVVLYDAQSLRELRAYTVADHVESLRFTPRGDQLIVRGKAGEATIDVSEAVRRRGAPVAPAPPPPVAGSWELAIGGEAEAHDIGVRNRRTGASAGTLARNVIEYATTGDGKRIVTLGRDGQVDVSWVSPEDVVADACRRVGHGLSDADRRTFLGNAAGTDRCKGSAG